VLVILEGMTSLLLVLDVVVNKPFWDHLRHLCREWLLSGNCLTSVGKIKKQSEALLMEWIKTAKELISYESVVHKFKKCCVSKSIDRADRI
jgi:hypothetical protein